jgi:hypothetical protein
VAVAVAAVVVESKKTAIAACPTALWWCGAESMPLFRDRFLCSFWACLGKWLLSIREESWIDSRLVSLSPQGGHLRKGGGAQIAVSSFCHPIDRRNAKTGSGQALHKHTIENDVWFLCVLVDARGFVLPLAGGGVRSYVWAALGQLVRSARKKNTQMVDLLVEVGRMRRRRQE